MLELSQNWENFEKLSKLKITSSFSLEHTDFENALFEKNSPGPFWRLQGRQGQMTSKLKMMKMLYENSFKIDKIQNFRGHGGQMLDFIYF